MNVLIFVPIVLPLLSAALTLVLGRWRPAQRVVSVIGVSGTLAAAVGILVDVERNGTTAVNAGAWDAPIGITLVADLFSALMLVVSAAMVLAVLVYAIGSIGRGDSPTYFHPVYLVLTAGVSAAFLTGDLFNLFVGVEVMLTASYVLITLGGSRDQVRSGMTYVVISLVASMLFLTGVAFVYASTGTVNLAHLAGRLDAVPDGMRLALGLLFLVVFGIKAAIFPLFFWLPDSYPTAPTPITAIFAGLLTKVGVYAIVRTQTLLFPADGVSTILLVIAGATMIVGVLGAISQNDVKRILSFHIVSQIGYMVMGLGLFSIAGLAGAIFYIVHHIVVKTTLFLVTGLVEQRYGTAALDRLGGLWRTVPLLGLLFLAPALSLAGLPPFSGFVAKLALVQAGLDQGQHHIVAVSLVVSLLTLFSMTKIWAGVFWGTPEGFTQEAFEVGAKRLPVSMVGPTAVLAAMSIVIAMGAGDLWLLSERAADQLLDSTTYVRTVLG